MTIDFSEELKKLHDNVVSLLRKDENTFQDLENDLNNLFYPSKTDKRTKVWKKREAIFQAATEALKERIDNESIISLQKLPEKKLTDLEVYKAKRAEYEQLSHKKSIQVQTLKNRYDAVYDALRKIQASKDAGKALKGMEELETQLNEYLELAKLILDDKELTYLKEGVISLEDESIWIYINELDKLFKDISVQVQLPTDTIGDILEIVLGYYSSYNLNKQIKGTEKELIDIVLGKQKTSSAKNKEVKTETTQLTQKEGSKKNDKQKYTIGVGSQELIIEVTPSYNDAYGRSQKTDVILNLPELNPEQISPLRVSAKNWNELKGDFGETSMAYAITRSYNKAFDVGSTKLSDKNSLLSQTFIEIGSNNLQTAHDLAKYSIAADILMGYSQSEGYVDTIIINDRSKPHIYVINLAILMENISKNIAEFKVSNYDETNFNTMFNNILTQTITLNGESYDKEVNKRELILRYLQSIDTTISFSAIQEYIKKEKSLDLTKKI